MKHARSVCATSEFDYEVQFVNNEVQELLKSDPLLFANVETTPKQTTKDSP